MADLKKIVFSKNTKEIPLEDNQEVKKIYYYAEDGFEQAGFHGGNMFSLRVHLNKIYQGYIEKNKRLQKSTDEKDEKLVFEKNNLEARKNTLLSKIDRLEKNKLEDKKEKIDELKNEISNIEENPNSADIEKPDKLGYYIGIAIILFLTLYLWIFYSSATFSAFFREIKFTENAVFNSIFYAKSFVESFELGFAAFLLTIVSPFVFIALGYLIHKFSEIKTVINYVKMSILVLVTFIFDCIIAFEITKKIYDALALNSFEDLPPYGLGMAMEDVNFWLIIFAGFVVYIVWGMVLGFVSDGYKNFDTVRAAIYSRKGKVNELKNDIGMLKVEITDFKNDILEIDGEIKNLDSAMGSTPFNRKEFEKIVNEFAAGWMRYLANSKEPESRLREAEQVCIIFIDGVTGELS